MTETEQFELLYRQTRRDVLAFLLRRVRNAEDAADLLADVYVVAWRRRAERPEGDHGRRWLFVVARNLVSAHARGEIRRRAAADGLRELLLKSEYAAIPDRPGPDLRSRLVELDDTDRELLIMTTFEGASTAEAARSLGLTPSAARVRLHRLRLQLKSFLADQILLG